MEHRDTVEKLDCMSQAAKVGSKADLLFHRKLGCSAHILLQVLICNRLQKHNQVSFVGIGTTDFDEMMVISNLFKGVYFVFIDFLRVLVMAPSSFTIDALPRIDFSGGLADHLVHNRVSGVLVSIGKTIVIIYAAANPDSTRGTNVHVRIQDFPTNTLMRRHDVTIII